MSELGGQKTKSARLSALEAAKSNKKRKTNSPENTSPENNDARSETEQRPDREDAAENAAGPSTDVQASCSGQGQEPLPERRKGQKRKRLDEVVSTSAAGPSTQQPQTKDEENPEDKELQTKSGKPGTSSVAFEMPDKHMLEFALDILQRRDTHEIFVQPIDPKKVMLYVDMEVNGVPLKAFVDSTIISKSCSKRCGLLRLLDQRYKGIDHGVGQSEILGRMLHLSR